MDENTTDGQSLDPHSAAMQQVARLGLLVKEIQERIQAIEERKEYLTLRLFIFVLMVGSLAALALVQMNTANQSREVVRSSCEARNSQQESQRKTWQELADIERQAIVTEPSQAQLHRDRVEAYEKALDNLAAVDCGDF